MQYFIYGFLLFIFLFILINYLRKLHWDAVHNNLFDLVDAIGGNVIRRGFLSRPVFHGNYKNCEVTINFSQEKKSSKRKHYINISINKRIKDTITIASVDWIRLQNENSDDLKILSVNSSKKYGIRIKGINNSTLKKLENKLEKVVPFNFIFMGHTGLIFEKESKNLGIDTKLNVLQPDIENIYNLTQLFN